MSSIPEDSCIRKTVVIDNENFYIIVGKDFAHATCPYENRSDMVKIRKIVDTVCQVITEAQGGKSD